MMPARSCGAFPHTPQLTEAPPRWNFAGGLLSGNQHRHPPVGFSSMGLKPGWLRFF